MRLFFRLMRPETTDTLMDLGGGVGPDFWELRNFFREVLIVDINEAHIKSIREGNKWTCLVGDGCHLPLKDRAVDFAFSNAVIEHLAKHKRELFAQEIRRVARKGYFVATPNYWFPYEPHYKMPLWQYLPDALKRYLSAKVSIGHYQKGSYLRIPLLNARELRRYFPRADLLGVKVTGFPIPEVLCASWRNDGT